MAGKRDPSPGEGYRVCWSGDHPQPKTVFHQGVFPNRQTARRWCHNNWPRVGKGLTIVHPDGVEEPYEAS